MKGIRFRTCRLQALPYSGLKLEAQKMYQVEHLAHNIPRPFWSLAFSEGETLNLKWEFPCSPLSQCSPNRPPSKFYQLTAPMRMQELAVAQKLALNKCCTHWETIRVILGLSRDNGKENGNYYILMVYMLGFHFWVFLKSTKLWFRCY